jgi:uncharacterized protein (DUF433 family)
MDDDKLLQRIVLNPDILVGKPVIKGTRLSVEYILDLLSHGDTIENILVEYNGLEKDDILACILYAGKMLDKSNIYLLETKVG